MSKNRSKELESILVITLGFMGLYLWLDKVILLYVGFGIGLLALLSVRAGRFILFIWEKIALILGYINSRILLSIIFYLILTPIAFFSKLSSGNKMTAKKDLGSFYKERNYTYSSGDLEKPW